MRRSTNRSIADACLDVAEELVAQPSLFDRDLVPLNLPVLRAAKRLSNTGKIATRDDATAMAIAACKLSGMGNAETAKRVGVTHHTVRNVIRFLEESGRIPSAQERMAHQLGEMAESASTEITKLIDQADGKWSPAAAGAVRALGIAVGIGVDKYQLLTGSPTQILEQRVGVPAADVVKEYEQKLREAFGPIIDVETSTTDSQSVVSPPKCLSDSSAPLIATQLATQSGHSEASNLGNQTESVAILVPTSNGGGGDRAAGAGREAATHSIE